MDSRDAVRVGGVEVRRRRVKRIVPGPVVRVPDAARNWCRRKRAKSELDRNQTLSLFSDEALPQRPIGS